MAGTRKITAIVVADIVGYSRLAGADEDRTLSRLRGLRSDLIDPAIDAHRGRIVKRTGDGSLIEFRSVVDAVLHGRLQSGWQRPHAAKSSVATTTSWDLERAMCRPTRQRYRGRL
jgi:class 3 adenylate cyclase